jgi:hypothetical protein
MQKWSDDPSRYQAFFRPPESKEQEWVQLRFVAAFARSMDAEAEALGVPAEYWRLETLSGNGHRCRAANVEGREGYLQPIGAGAWSAHELHCSVDWECNGWCRSKLEQAGLASVLALLARQRDPVGKCAFRAFFATLQGGFGLPQVRPGIPGERLIVERTIGR